MQFRLRTLLVVLAIGPPVLAFFIWSAMRGGFEEALNIVGTIAFIVWSVAGIHYAIKRNLGY